MLRTALIALSALALLPAAAHAAAPVTETASAGQVTATFTHRDAGEGRWADINVTITRGGVPAYSAAPKVKDCPAPYCAPFGAFDKKPSIRVLDVSGDEEPEVVVNFSTGGAHCCEIALVLRWSGTAYVASTRNFADFGYTLDTSGDAAFPAAWVTGDARFAYAFAPFADSPFPVRIYTFSRGTWSDQTGAHEDAIRADAARQLK